MSAKEMKNELIAIQKQFNKVDNMLVKFNNKYINIDSTLSVNWVSGDGLILVDDRDNSEILDIDEIIETILSWEGDNNDRRDKERFKNIVHDICNNTLS